MVLLLSGSASNPPANALQFAAAAHTPFFSSTVQSSVCVNNIAHFCLGLRGFFVTLFSISTYGSVLVIYSRKERLFLPCKAYNLTAGIVS